MEYKESMGPSAWRWQNEMPYVKCVGKGKLLLIGSSITFGYELKALKI